MAEFETDGILVPFFDLELRKRGMVLLARMSQGVSFVGHAEWKQR